MNKKKIFFIILQLSLCFSCRNELQSSDSKTYPVEFFVAHKLNNFMDPRLFTKSSEIRDTVLRNKYARDFSIHFVDSSHSCVAPGYESFSFINDDSMINIMPTETIFAKRIKVEQYDKYSSGYQQLTGAGTEPAQSNAYHDQKPSEFILKKTTDTLYLPFFKYVTIARSHDKKSLDSARLNNPFSLERINHLGLSDTMIVQAFELIMTKKR